MNIFSYEFEFENVHFISCSLCQEKISKYTK